METPVIILEALAIISHLFHYVLTVAAVYFCIMLFLRRRDWGWLLLISIFVEPLYLLLVRVIRGGPFLPYKSRSVDSNGIAELTYNFNFPFSHILAVLGLFLLFRQAHTKTEGRDEVV